jgi:hypothetical protein
MGNALEPADPGQARKVGADDPPHLEDVKRADRHALALPFAATVIDDGPQLSFHAATLKPLC